jgi:hypothetical protein
LTDLQSTLTHLQPRGVRSTFLFGWIIGPKGVSRVQRPEDLATLALILCRWISKAFTDPSGQPRLAQESWRARRGPARQSNPSRICWRCSDSFLAPAAATDSRSVCGPPVGSQAQELALGFAHTRFSRWCWGLHLPLIGFLVETFRFDLSYRLSFFVLTVCVSYVSV